MTTKITQIIFFISIISISLSNNSFANNEFKAIAENSTFELCTSDFSITRKSAETFFMNDDISPEKRGQYALYEIENTGTTSAEVYVKADNFSGDVRLGDSEDDTFYIGELQGGEKGYAYIYLVTDVTIAGQNDFLNTTSTHAIKVYDGDPNDTGILKKTETFSIALVEDVIKANANKVESVTITGTPTLGETFTMTVTGTTGTIGAAKIFNFSAATNIDWVADAYELINTEVTFSKVSGSNNNHGLVFSNNLYFILNDTKNTFYEITYTFLVDGSSSGTSGFEPTTYVSSGQQIKHSILATGVTVPDLPPIPAPKATLSGFVWNDEDYDGIKQGNESKMNGVHVRLLDDQENLLQSTSSSGTTGNFEFSDIEAGNYKIRFDRNDRFVPTKQDATNDDALDSDINRASRIVEITVEEGIDIENITAGFTPDFDRDLIPDVVEIAGGTSYDVVDPAGYFYDESTGKIIAGGYIHVSGPGRIDIVDTGNVDGYYSWLIDGTPGVYTMTITPPLGYSMSTNRLPKRTLDPTGLTPDPYSVGSPDGDGDKFLDDFSESANPFYMDFELASGDPFIIDNNIPLMSISLPVEMSQWTGRVKSCEAELTWQTASETNFSHFEIEKSDDGATFRKVTRIEAMGGILPTNYYYKDEEKLKNKTTYYRLKMIDLDRSFEYSPVISLKPDCEKEEEALLYPNILLEGQREMTLKFTSKKGNNSFYIFDGNGSIVKSFSAETIKGENKLNINVSNLPSGRYSIGYYNFQKEINPIPFIIIE